MPRFLVVLCFLYPFLVKAQHFGGLPPRYEWQQINSEHFRIIFDSSNRQQALKVASIITRSEQQENNIGSKRRKINTVFRNSTTESNGYVGLAPFRSEYFLTPFPDNHRLGSLDWPSTLAIHEYQHVLQMSNTYYGLSKYAYWLGGDFSLLALQALSIPNWFLEGDAVRAETQYSMQGRGRLPSFMNEFRAYALKDSFPSYEILRNGSINRLTPSHYPLGYLMCSYGLENYSTGLWSKVLREASAYKGFFYPFSHSLKKNTGSNTKQFYRKAGEWFSKEIEAFTSHETAPPLFKNKKEEVVTYAFPQTDSLGNLAYYYSTYDQIGHIYLYNGKEQLQLVAPPIRSSNYFDFDGKYLLYTGNRFNPRWGWIDYSDLFLYNIATREEKRVTFRQKLFQPSLSPNGKEIVALEVPSDLHFRLIVLDLNGKVIDSIPNPGNYYHSYPQWSDENTFICASRNPAGEMALCEVDRKSGELRPLSEWTYHVIGVPNVNAEWIFFSSTYSGSSQIYALERSTKKLYTISNDGIGNYQAFYQATSQELYTSSFTLRGNVLQKRRWKTSEKGPSLNHIPSLSELSYNQLSFLQNTPNLLTSAEKVDSFLIKPYSKAAHLINIHSWGPTFSHPEYSFSVHSEDILNTLQLSAKYSYNTNEKASHVSLEGAYAQWYPIITFGISEQNRSAFIREDITGKISWDQTLSSLGLELPFNLSAGRSFRQVALQSKYNYVKVDFDSEFRNNEKLHVLSNSFLFTQERLKARKNIYSHWGIFSFFQNQYALNENGLKQSSWQNSITLRGLSKNHNLLLDADAQWAAGRRRYSYIDRFVYPRGYSDFFHTELYKLGANYHFPIFYPNKGYHGIIYGYRLRSNLFLDYASNKRKGSNEFMSSGIELIADLKLLNLLDLSLGLRYSYLWSNTSYSLNNSRNVVEIFIPLNRF
jgi:hypothetical protein